MKPILFDRVECSDFEEEQLEDDFVEEGIVEVETTEEVVGDGVETTDEEIVRNEDCQLLGN